MLRAVAAPLAIVDAEARCPALCYALPFEPEEVIEILLADPRVTEARLASLGTCRGPETRFVLERTERGFILAGRASEPGVWEPGAYAVLRAQIRGRESGGSELVLRFALHPLTRSAYLTLVGVAGLIIPLQFWTTGLLLGTAMMFPIVLAAMVVGLDARRLRAQRADLQRLVEEIFAPLELAREPCPRSPFRVAT